MFGNRKPDEKQIQKTLDAVLRSVPEVQADIRVRDGGRIMVALTCFDRHVGDALEQPIKDALGALKGIEEVHVVVSVERGSQEKPKPRRMIAVASGKGGVGKSTVTTNLARALRAQGLQVGVLDADIYGPSIPKMMKLEGQKPQGAQGSIEPLVSAEGIKVMSIGFMAADPDAPLIWRGPMLHGALNQLVNDVNWGALDVVLIDMPPGTGDVALTLGQKANLDGAVLVTTPQDIALIDARKAANMFKRLNIPIFGVVENMATYCCPNCGHEEAIFGDGGGAAEAEKLDVPYLGKIPLSRPIREAADAGEVPDLEVYKAIADHICGSEMQDESSQPHAAHH